MAILVVVIAGFSVSGQSLIVVNDPVTKQKTAALTAAEKRVMQRDVLPKVRKILASDVCREEDYAVSNAAKGAFTRPSSQQTLVFYQYCQTGNGLGSVGVAVIENGKLEASYIAEEGGWTVDVRTLPDIDQNGLDEAALFFSGGMHQGEGGTGVEVIEFSNGKLKNLGWFNADQFFDSAPSIAYRVSVKKGASPVFYRQKFTSRNEKTWRPVGKQVQFRLDKPITTFTAVR